ncbi:hypothetical protein [Parabacteroides sp. PF5-6]|uniref:hypothetical protein n=1 Tax=Parabacteroides sp. PF5-6 TaxID=1742403 RepID=UPI002404C71A|nr:hypothetical protein [Parabacteroides sp. PF5-6]MDF9828830.1 hypothetical protein [Parabacteroides sp. PF5-6]
MTVLERKEKLIAAILNDPDEERFAELESIYEKLSMPSFMCSVEELNESIRRQEEDFAAGKIKTIPHEEVRLTRKIAYED